MNKDQLRALAGIPMVRDIDGKKTVIEQKFAPVKADGHFDITVPESKVGKLAVALAKEGLPVDVTYDGMENFFFNFKSSELKDKAEKVVKSIVREDVNESKQVTINIDWADDADSETEEKLKRNIEHMIQNHGLNGATYKIKTMKGPAGGWPVVEITGEESDLRRLLTDLGYINDESDEDFANHVVPSDDLMKHVRDVSQGTK